ncbi:MAG: endopeptidase La [Patescibacteria group bacterium]
MNQFVPLMILHNTLLFPHINRRFESSERSIITLLKNVITPENPQPLIGVTMASNSNLYEVGVLAVITEFQEEADFCIFTIKAQQKRFKIINTRDHEKGYKIAEISVLEDEFPKTKEEKNKAKALLSVIKELWTELLDYIEADEHFETAFNDFEDLLANANLLSNLPKTDKQLYLFCLKLEVPSEQSQEILEEMNFEKRMEKIVQALTATIAFEKIKSGIIKKYINEKEATLAKDSLLFFQKQIQEKLKADGDNNNFLQESDTLLNTYQQLKPKISKEAQLIIEDELRQLQRNGHDANTDSLRTHLGYCLKKMPWGKETEDNPDFNAVKNILDQDHCGLEKIKTRILEHLAVKKLNPQGKSPIICFVGPPGVGKTSLGKSIARALGRKFTKISLGGVRDETEIRGHRRTYVASFPGRIIEGIIKAEAINPVFMIDEIDKIAKEHGDPAAALLEVLDPEQNHSFQDHYINFGFDLRKVFFIATANMIDESMPPALTDRLEIINLSGYAEFEKIKIGQQYLIPKQIQETGVGHIDFTEEAIKLIIQHTDEAGVRDLERQVHKILRIIALKIANGESYPRIIEPNIISQPDFLGSSALITEKVRKITPGVSIGLAWTEAGGCILYIETIMTKGTGQVSKTGGLGERLQDSIKVAQTLIRAIHKKIDFDEKLVHVHVPRFFNTDGPSAGLAIYIALESMCRKKPSREKLAMTGEINLERLVLGVGGIREKMLAAERAGIKEIILPKENEKDLEDVPKEIKDKLIFHIVETIDEAIKIAFSSN